MCKFYVIGVYGEQNYSVLGLDGGSMQECKRRIAWQGPCGTPYHICKPSDVRGVFTSVETGNLFQVNRGAYTEKAFENALAEIWGASSLFDDVTPD